VREALRLWPIAWQLARRPARTHEVAGIEVTPRHQVLVSPYVTHRHPAYWSEPGRFRPERWAEEPAHRAFLPFGWGPHTCAAAALTLELVAQVLTALLRDHRLAVSPHSDRPFTGPSLAPPPFRLALSPKATRLLEERAHRVDRAVGEALRAAPVTNRFVRETLRKWSSPLVLTRVAQKPLAVDREMLEPGDLFHLSAYFVLHDPNEWDDPETFDPDRWLPGSGRGPARSCAHVPFGWSPTSCIGAGLGTIELMLLARLFTTRYRIDAIDPQNVEIVLASVPLPAGFRGVISRRGDSS